MASAKKNKFDDKDALEAEAADLRGGIARCIDDIEPEDDDGESMILFLEEALGHARELHRVQEKLEAIEDAAAEAEENEDD